MVKCGSAYKVRDGGWVIRQIVCNDAALSRVFERQCQIVGSALVARLIKLFQVAGFVLGDRETTGNAVRYPVSLLWVGIGVVFSR